MTKDLLEYQWRIASELRLFRCLDVVPRDEEGVGKGLRRKGSQRMPVSAQALTVIYQINRLISKNNEKVKLMDQLRSDLLAVDRRFVLEKDRIASITSTAEDLTDLSHFTDSQFEMKPTVSGGIWRKILNIKSRWFSPSSSSSNKLPTSIRTGMSRQTEVNLKQNLVNEDGKTLEMRGE